MDINSYLPYEGKIILKNKTAQKAYIRIPNWVDKQNMTCAINKKNLRLDWLNNYLIVDNLSKNDEIKIEFEMVTRTESYKLDDKEFTFTFKGNTVIDLKPRSEGLVYPIYMRDKYFNNQAPLITKKRYVFPREVLW